MAVVAARGWLGTPYRHQASVKGVGADCLGLVRGVWREVVGEEPEAVPAYAADWAEVGGEERLLEAAGRWLAGLEAEVVGEDLALRWTPRARLFGDSWEGETAASDPERYRVEVLKDGAIVRSWEATEASAVYAAMDRTADFVEGEEGRVRVAQWGEAFGWGAAAEIALP